MSSTDGLKAPIAGGDALTDGELGTNSLLKRSASGPLPSGIRLFSVLQVLLGEAAL